MKIFLVTTAMAAATLSVVAAQLWQGQIVAPADRQISSGPELVDAVLDRLDQVRTVRETALSPDGARVAWVADAPPGKGGTSITVRELPSGDPISITAGSGSGSREGGIAWSPDGRSLAFLSDAGGNHQLDLYVATLGSSGVFSSSRKVTTKANGQLAHPIWSPDGKRIAMLYVEG